MLWIKNFLKTGFGIFCLVFVPALFFCFFLGTNKTFAVSDYSYILDSSHIRAVGLCHNTNPSSSLSGSSCFDFNYIIFSTSYDFSSLSTDSYLTFSSHNYIQFNSIHNTVVFGIPRSDTSLSVFITNLSYLPSDWNVTITLSESFPSISSPSGTLNISQNGTYDVTSYAEAVVDIPPEIEYGDYHDDLLSIKHSIYVCGAIVLVLYFFYCIYRMIIKSTGGH